MRYIGKFCKIQINKQIIAFSSVKETLQGFQVIYSVDTSYNSILKDHIWLLGTEIYIIKVK